MRAQQPRRKDFLQAWQGACPLASACSAAKYGASEYVRNAGDSYAMQKYEVIEDFVAHVQSDVVAAPEQVLYANDGQWSNRSPPRCAMILKEWKRDSSRRTSLQPRRLGRSRP